MPYGRSRCRVVMMPADTASRIQGSNGDTNLLVCLRGRFRLHIRQYYRHTCLRPNSNDRTRSFPDHTLRDTSQEKSGYCFSRMVPITIISMPSSRRKLTIPDHGRENALTLVNSGTPFRFCAETVSSIASSFSVATLRSLPMNPDRKSTRLNSSHGYISYAVFC